MEFVECVHSLSVQNMSDASNTAQLPGSILRELSDIVDKRKASVELNPKDVD